MDDRLTAVAGSRGGVFTSAMAAVVDVDDGALARGRRSQEVVRVRRDAYVLGELWSAATPEQRLMLRTRAVLAARPEDIASHQSALALHGLPLHERDQFSLDMIDENGKEKTFSGGSYLHPRQVLRELEKAMPPDVMVSTDIGNINSVANSYLRFEKQAFLF